MKKDKETAALSPPPSEWNGHDVGWSRAEKVFEQLNSLAFRCSQADAPVAHDVGDVLDAVAWSLNRNDTAALATLARVARGWLRTARPLYSDATKRELTQDLDPSPLFPPARDPSPVFANENGAYEHALSKVELILQTYDVFGVARGQRRALSAERCAWLVSCALRKPFRRLSDAALVELAKWIATAKKRGQAPDADRVVSRALRLTSMSGDDIKRLKSGQDARVASRRRREGDTSK